MSSVINYLFGSPSISKEEQHPTSTTTTAAGTMNGAGRILASATNKENSNGAKNGRDSAPTETTSLLQPDKTQRQPSEPASARSEGLSPLNDLEKAQPVTEDTEVAKQRRPTVKEFYFTPDNPTVQRFYRFSSTPLTPIAALHKRPSGNTPRNQTPQTQEEVSLVS